MRRAARRPLQASSTGSSPFFRTFFVVGRDSKTAEKLKALFGLDPVHDYAFDGCNLGFAKGDGQRTAARENPAPSITYME